MVLEVGTDAREQFRGALHGERLVPSAEQGSGESVPHEGGVVGDEDGFAAHEGTGASLKRIGSASKLR